MNELDYFVSTIKFCHEPDRADYEASALTSSFQPSWLLVFCLIGFIEGIVLKVSEYVLILVLLYYFLHRNHFGSSYRPSSISVMQGLLR